MSAEDAIYSLMGTAATYTPVSGAAASVTVLIDEEADASAEDMQLEHPAEIRVRQSEVTAKPAYRSTFTTLNGAGTSQSWEVMAVKEARDFGDFGGEWVCICVRNVRPTL
jgi:hypothetical protein